MTDGSSSSLSIGDHCAAQTCNLISFLPITCPTCNLPFCSAHIHSDWHSCFVSKGKSIVLGRFEERVNCPIDGCVRKTLESAGKTKGYNGGAVQDIGKMIRCDGCKIAFCVVHRTQQSHQCASPTPEQLAQRAKLARQEAAREKIASSNPGRMAKAIPKPPPGKIITGLRVKEKLATSDQAIGPAAGPPSQPEDGHLQSSVMDPSTLSAPGISSSNPTAVSSVSVAASPPPSARDQKLAQIRLMKLKSRAEPLHPSFARSHILPEEMAFFEYLWDPEGKQVEKKDAGAAKFDVAWVAKDTTLGRVLDLLANKLALIHQPNQADTSKNLYLMTTGGIGPLNTSNAIGDAIEQGGRLIVVRGPVWTR